MEPTYYLVLVVMWFSNLIQIEPSTTDYCKIEPDRHFLCEDKTIDIQYCRKDVDFYTAPVFSIDRKEALKALNDIRAGVANGSLRIGHPKFTPPQAANMYKLEWDMECEKAAKNIVKYCAHSFFSRKFSNIFARFEAGLFLDVDFHYPRENIMTIADLLWYKIKGNATNIHDIKISSSGNVVGTHNSFYETKLSILVKAEVSVVGCAMVIQNTGHTLVSFLACVFGGIATWDKPLYDKGLPCSRCLAESQCSKAYTSLCECKTRCYSYSKDVKNTGFFSYYAIVVDKETNKDKIIPLKNLTYDSTYRYLHSTPATTTKTDYCKIVPNRHFLCEEETITEQHCRKKAVTYPLNEMDRKYALKALNDIRAGVANGTLHIGHPKFTPPQAANMYELKWDKECEKAARNLVKYCDSLPFHSKFSNIFARFEAGLFLETDLLDSGDNINSIADLLWHKIKGNDKFFHDISISTYGNVIGRPNSFYLTKLSLLIKAEVYVVGCAMMTENLGTYLESYLACVFGGIATWDNPLNLYEKGPPCSRCLADSQCSKEGLCGENQV